MRELINTLSQQEKPKFHEISTYLIALSFCWLFIFHSELRQGFFLLFSGFGTFSLFFLALGLIVGGGIFLSLIHPFTQRKKSPFEKAIMVWVVMGISGVVSFFVGIEILPTRSSILMILLIWNIIMSVVLIIQMGRQKYDLSDKDASLMDIYVTTVVLLVILLFADLYLRLSWAITLSICIFYATTILYITNWLIDYFDLQLPIFRNKVD